MKQTDLENRFHSLNHHLKYLLCATVGVPPNQWYPVPVPKEPIKLSETPGSGRSPRKGHGNPLRYSCLENPMDRGAWQATVSGVTKSRI